MIAQARNPRLRRHGQRERPGVRGEKRQDARARGGIHGNPDTNGPTTWEGPLASGTGTVRLGSGAAGELPVTWAGRTERADGKTSAEDLAATAHSACYALARQLGEREAAPQRLAITATVTLDQADGVAAIVSSHLDVTARVPGLGKTAFDTVVDEASARCPVSRLFTRGKITVDATLEPAP
ncbi:MAG TPA: OsmC family peroxiredoxin [Streptosporangiaceae bacterium]|nr:OsmC family peroxiredoxin [Streptosporangiaceae bacterium]